MVIALLCVLFCSVSIKCFVSLFHFLLTLGKTILRWCFRSNLPYIWFWEKKSFFFLNFLSKWPLYFWVWEKNYFLIFFSSIMPYFLVWQRNDHTFGSGGTIFLWYSRWNYSLPTYHTTHLLAYIFRLAPLPRFSVASNNTALLELLSQARPACSFAIWRVLPSDEFWHLLCIMWTPIESPLKPLDTIVPWCSRGPLINWVFH